ncbi:hypothetical protein CORC01_09732 [Colletotrichum orchidophilum]|uniref:Fucose-specific lectin n=1 Tax=Colletotrichum orchidophilum TaxID=1209926 RepID=A0A1G4B0I9_9PEZI|nr:uncharacterized protein CORC01_09732 [Colletotrichum orchidophilum]OHE94938.1 hypothetical protein CORC01_09732 [Colletotrichum orchidophilum]
MDHSARSAQPGLEVSSEYDDTPIFLDDRTPHWQAPSQNGTGYDEHKTLANGYSSLAQGGNVGGHVGGQETQRPARRFPWCIAIIVALVVLVLGGVIGGVVAWRVTANRNQQSKAGVPGSVSGDTPSTNATKIMQNSALSAVGWRYGSDITLQVFFQGPDNSLRRSQYMTIYQNWTSPMEAGAAPKVGSPFGAGQLWTKPVDAEVFYIGSPDRILGVNWRDGFSRGGLTDSVNEAGYTISNTGTQMASYWPSTILQASDGDVMEVFYDYKSPRFQEPKTVGVTASPGSALVILPREVIHSAGDQTASSSARIIYRSTDGHLQNYDRSSGGQQLTSTGQLPVTVDSNFTMAGFAVARLDSGGQKSDALNTWILYQDSKTGKISYVYEDDATGWKGPETDSVFEGADNPTHLACVTAASATSPEVPLEASHDLSHCFFQMNRQLKHVHFDGSKWADMGFLPIP